RLAARQSQLACGRWQLSGGDPNTVRLEPWSALGEQTDRHDRAARDQVAVRHQGSSGGARWQRTRHAQSAGDQCAGRDVFELESARQIDRGRGRATLVARWLLTATTSEIRQRRAAVVEGAL